MKENNNKGFSMIELIVAIAIMAILTGSFVSAAGYLKYANAKSGAKKINTALSELRIDSMSRMKTPYMYLYKIDGSVYMKVVAGAGAADAIANGLLDKNTTRVGNAQIKVSCDGAEIAEGVGNAVKINMVKSTGAFATAPDKIEVASRDGKTTYEIHLVKTTGRHYIEE